MLKPILITNKSATITRNINGYTVTRNGGQVIKCHNLATAKWYARNVTTK